MGTARAHGRRFGVAPLVCALALFAAADAFSQARTGSHAPSGASSVEVQRKNKKPALNLVMDYLPAVLYQGSDPLTIVCRVENDSADPREITVQAAPKGDAGLEAGEKTATIAPGAYLRFEHTFRGGTYKTVLLSVTSDGLDAIQREIQMVDPKDDLPTGLQAEGGHLALTGNKYAVLRIEKRIYKKNETWKLARFIYKAVKSAEIPKNILVYGHPMEDAPADLDSNKVGIMGKPLSNAKAASGVTLTRKPMVIGRHEYTYPVLKLLANLDNALSAANPKEGAVLLLGPDDPKFATPRRLYRMTIEAILDRMEAAGITRTLVVGPATRSVPERQVQSYVESAHKASLARRARFLDITEVLTEEHWRPDGDSSVLARYPSADGLKVAADAILKSLE